MSNRRIPGKQLWTLYIALSILLVTAIPVRAEISVGISFPGINIGINVPSYPDLVLVPGYPVYYDPRGDSNYFFSDGQYWVYQRDAWYASSWYNGPWQRIGPELVPLFVLRVPVAYYRRPPAYFRNWRADAPPHWGEHWGRDWQERRSGWDRWDHHAAPYTAPLPRYQRRYSGDSYPHALERQQAIRSEHYDSQRRDVPVQRFPPAHTLRGAPPVRRDQAAHQDSRRENNRAPQGKDRKHGNQGHNDDRG